MASTGLWPVTTIVPNRATGYLYTEDDPLGLGPRYSNGQFLGYGANGAGGEYSTVGDMFALFRVIASQRLLGAKATEEMLTPRIAMAGAPRPTKYGYGVETARAPAIRRSATRAVAPIAACPRLPTAPLIRLDDHCAVEHRPAGGGRPGAVDLRVRRGALGDQIEQVTNATTIAKLRDKARIGQ